jgi:hypothetical protein
VACIVQANGCFHVHVSQVIGIHDKDLDNDGETTTKLIPTIATDDPISTDVLIDRIWLSVISFCSTSLVQVIKGRRVKSIKLKEGAWDTIPDTDKKAMILDQDTSVLQPCGNHPICACWSYCVVDTTYTTTYCHEFGLSVPEMTVTNIRTDMESTDPDDIDANLLAHATQHTWRETNDCDISEELTTGPLSDLSVLNLTKLWYLNTGKGHCIRIQDVNGIQWRVLALQVETAQVNAPSNVCALFSVPAMVTLSSRLEEDGEHIYEHINNKLNERNSDTQWRNVTVLELAIIAKHQDYMQI